MRKVESPGEEAAQIYAKIPEGVNAFWTKLPWGPLLWVLWYFLASFLKICPMCIYALNEQKKPMIIQRMPASLYDYFGTESNNY
jgi:hypothetical protein